MLDFFISDGEKDSKTNDATTDHSTTEDIVDTVQNVVAECVDLTLDVAKKAVSNVSVVDLVSFC